MQRAMEKLLQFVYDKFCKEIILFGIQEGKFSKYKYVSRKLYLKVILQF